MRPFCFHRDWYYMGLLIYMCPCLHQMIIPQQPKAVWGPLKATLILLFSANSRRPENSQQCDPSLKDKDTTWPPPID